MDSDSDFDFEPAPDSFRSLFTGQALSHLDEIVLSWHMGGHPIAWSQSEGIFQVNLEGGPVMLFRLLAPVDGFPARVEVDSTESVSGGIPSELFQRLWNELAFIGKLVENPHAPLLVPLAKFSRGDRKVFLAYALTIARCIAVPPEQKAE
jgi:hypothetical protein